MSLHQYFKFLLGYRDILIQYLNEFGIRAFGCELIILSWFYYPAGKLSELPGRRHVTMNIVYLQQVFFNERYGSIDYKIMTLDKLIKKNG